MLKPFRKIPNSKFWIPIITWQHVRISNGIVFFNCFSLVVEKYIAIWAQPNEMRANGEIASSSTEFGSPKSQIMYTNTYIELCVIVLCVYIWLVNADSIEMFDRVQKRNDTTIYNIRVSKGTEKKK